MWTADMAILRRGDLQPTIHPLQTGWLPLSASWIASLESGDQRQAEGSYDGPAMKQGFPEPLGSMKMLGLTELLANRGEGSS